MSCADNIVRAFDHLNRTNLFRTLVKLGAGAAYHGG